MKETNRTLWRSWVLCLIATAITVPLSIAYADRPLAVLFNRHIIETGYFKVLVWFVRPLGPMVVLTMIMLMAGGIRVLSGGDVPRRIRPLIVPAIAIGIGIGAELVLKTISARSEIWPTFMRDDQYGFDLLHYRDGWRSFPSGTAIGLFALVGVLFVHRARWRYAVLSAAVLICTVVTVVTYHWLSDVLAGIFVGLTIGYGTGSMIKSFGSGETTP